MSNVRHTQSHNHVVRHASESPCFRRAPIPAHWLRQSANTRLRANQAWRSSMSIASAIQGQHLLSFSYEGYPRTAEPHTYGIDGKGHHALRAYQVAGGSSSGEYAGWKLFHVNEMHGLFVLPQRFAGPRPGYKQGDKAFSTILAQL